MPFSFRLRGQNYSAASLKELSEIYAGIRDRSGEGGSTFPHVNVTDGKKIIGHISYNARIWEGPRKWTGSVQPGLLYDNRTPAAAQLPIATSRREAEANFAEMTEASRYSTSSKGDQ